MNGDIKQSGILIIDDVISNLVVLADIIKEAGYTARPVTSVKQAKDAIMAELPSLILLDVTMPERDGYEYCIELKKEAVTRDIPVIFISALTSASDRIRGFECGAVDFISKPFERAEVLVRVNTHLKLYNMQKDQTQYNKKLHNLVNKQLNRIAEERKNMICSIARIVESRDDCNAEHLIFVSKNCRLVALSLQLTHKYEDIITNDFITTIEYASYLHDIGKISVTDEILLKKDTLTEDEEKKILKHVETGSDVLRDILSLNENNEFIRMGMDIAYYHHEKWDGTGYPNGIAKTDIPLAARITSVIDVYDALTGERCYKKGYSHAAAMKIINAESGKSFDPDIVNILNRIQRQLKRNETNLEAGEDIPYKIATDGRR